MEDVYQSEIPHAASGEKTQANKPSKHRKSRKHSHHNTSHEVGAYLLPYDMFNKQKYILVPLNI